MPELSERLAGLTGGDRECDRAVSAYLRPQPEGYREAYPPNWTSDLSAVVAEIERRGWTYQLHRYPRKAATATVWWGHRMFEAAGQTACIAMLLALVAAVQPAESTHVPT